MVQDIPVHLTESPADVISALRCPHCQAPVSRAGTGLGCRNGHHFDIAKHGYAHLGTGRKLPEGDDVTMVTSRQSVLETGCFAPLANAIADSVADSVAGLGGLVVELGAGTGYYLAAALDAKPGAYGLAFDVSKPALRRAARAHRRAAAVLADTWGRLPLADQCVDVMLNVFAPRNGPEMRRVLRPDATLLVATPTQAHLRALRDALGLLDVDPAKDERLARSLPEFRLAGERIVDWRMMLPDEGVLALAQMGPSARHIGAEQLRERLARHGGPVEIVGSVRLTTWHPR